MAFCITVFITKYSMKLSNTISYCSSAQKSRLFRRKQKKKNRRRCCVWMYLYVYVYTLIMIWYKARKKKRSHGLWWMKPQQYRWDLVLLKYCRLKPFEFTTFHIMAKIIPEHFVTDSLFCVAADAIAVVGRPTQSDSTSIK